MSKRKPAELSRELRVLNGINWPDGKGGEHRRERGDMVAVADLGEYAQGLIDHGDVESLEETAPADEAVAEGKE